MSRFDNKTCPVCKIALNDKSDIVVCPVCGTPHHRACYMRDSRCGVESYHASGFIWNGSLPWERQAETPTEKSSDPHVAEYPEDTPQFINARTGEPMDMPTDMAEFLNSIRHQTTDETRGEDEVSSRELSSFVGKSVIHYSNAFRTFRTSAGNDGKRHRIFFNFCSGFFMPIHQFYRRMDGIGIILLLLELACYIPSLLAIVGIGSVSALENIQMLASVVNFAAMMFMSMFGDYFYYRFCVRRIKKIRQSFDDGKAPGYYEALSEKGTPSWLRTIVAVLAVYLAEACLMLYMLQLGGAAAV